MALQKITPFLWYDTQAEEAARFYTSIFSNSKVGKITRYGDAGPGPAGSVMVVEFALEGMKFVALNGGPHFKFNEAVSFVVNCNDQAEVDHYWSRLQEGGGKEIECGWLKDRFGLAWQIVPNLFFELVSDPDPAKSQRVMKAMMTMKKFDCRRLQEAYGNG